MRQRVNPQGVTLGDRILSALLTPLVFNIGLIIFLAINSSSWQFVRSVRAFYGGSDAAAYVMLGLPAAIGFLAGSRGTAKILGHAFWTNPESEKSVLATLVVWVCFLGLLLYAQSHPAS